jgi:hypothetical protein
MHCACCSQPIDPKLAWKGASERFYCSEFCADSEEPEAEAAPAAATGTGTLLQLHLNRPYERLERLLPYMRAYSGRARPAPRKQSPASQVA